MGILAIHISNRHLDLKPVVAALARELSKVLISRRCEGDTFDPEAFTSSDWILLTQNEGSSSRTSSRSSPADVVGGRRSPLDRSAQQPAADPEIRNGSEAARMVEEETGEEDAPVER